MVSPLESYIAGWRRHDVDAVLASVSENCVIPECYGPVYRGADRVRQWMDAWFAAGGKVIDWQITHHAALGDTEIAEWVFTCMWKGEEATFDGATIARLENGRIASLREYATTAPLYDWSGAWRES